MKICDREWKREELLKRVGDISQLAGIRRLELAEGNEKGVEAAELRSGSGLRAVILLSRAMDLGFVEYAGRPLCWRSPVGDAHPAFYEPQEDGWLRTFYGGMMNTCGLTYFGAPCDDAGKRLGVHGRASHLPARLLASEGAWQDGEYRLTLKGRIRESTLFGENVSLTRTYTMTAGEDRILLHDVVENEGYRTTEHMILYHVNVGFPVLDEGSELLLTVRSTRPLTEHAAQGLADYNRFGTPVAGFQEQVYLHRLAADGQGRTGAALVNRRFNQGQGLGVYIRFPEAELPCFNQWKMIGEGTYVVGLEPANAFVITRARARADGSLQFLEPGERRQYHLELGVLHSNAEIESFEGEMKGLVSREPAR